MKKKIISYLLAFIFLINCIINPISTYANSNRDLSKDDFPSTEFNLDSKIRVIIEAKDERAKESLKSYITKLNKSGIKNDYDLVFNGFSAEISEHDYYKLKLDPRVKNITKAKVFYPTMASAKSLAQVFEAQEKYANNGEGMVISIIDSGLDLSHKDFQRLDRPEKAKIKDVMPYGGENLDTHFNLKVPYGYNFADNSYRVKGYASNHGIHVAGIAGANSRNSELESFAGIDGIASQAQILAMMVFSNNPELKGAQEDDIIAAIEKSIEKEADIINMSLGSSSGFMDDNDPTAKAIQKAKEKGILVVVAAGNDTAAFSNRDGSIIENYGGRNDIGLVGSPSTARAAWSVASFENTHTFLKTFEFNDGDEKISFPYTIDNGKNDERLYKIEDAGLGKKEDFVGKDFTGKLAVIKRGEITFTEKSQNAKDAGAIGAIIYNSNDVKTGYSIEGLGDFPVFNILNSAGVRLLEAYSKNKDVEVKFNLKEEQVANDNNGKMSGFTSFGTTSNLDFKPEITGVGGRVYSTDNDGKYVMMDGTSMASPYVAGASAIVYSQVRNDVENIGNVAEFTRKTMMNTAKVLVNPDIDGDIPFSVRRQGAGLVQVKDAIENRVIASYEHENGNAAGELRNFDGIKTFEINLKNYSNKDLSFDIDLDRVYTTRTIGIKLVEDLSTASIQSDLTEVTIKANSSTNVSITIDASSVNDEFIEGYVKFISKDENQPSIHFPYMGFAGDWNAENIVDNLDTIENQEEIVFGDTKLISMIKDPNNIFDQGTIFSLGIEIDKLGIEEKPSQDYWSISPNEDGFADIVIPQLGVLRNAEVLEFNILDEDKNIIRKLSVEENVRRQSLRDYISRIQSGQMFKVYPFVEGMWDGKIYNPKNGEFEVAKDGQYYIEAAAKLNKNTDYQKRLFPIKIDTKAPKIELIKTDNGEDYEITRDGRLLRFNITDEVGISSFYGRLGDKKLNAELIGGEYQILIPFNVETSETLKVFANDYALNESSMNIENIKGNSLSFTKWESVVDKKINTIMGKDYSGITNNPDTSYISIKFVNKDTGEEIDSKESPVRNGRFAFASYILTNDQQGKYLAYAIEKDKNKEEIKRTYLGEFVYDYIAPTLEFNYAEIVTGDDVKNPLGNQSEDYVEYIMKKNPDNTVTFTGKVQDNVYSPDELKLTIGSRSNIVPINRDGSFEYVLETPSEYFDFINISQPGDSSKNNSDIIDGLDLAVTPDQTNKKGLERTYVINSYIDSDEVLEQEEFKLTTAAKVIINSETIGTNEAIKAEKIGDEYFYTISGFTNRVDNRILLDGEEIFRKNAVDNGSYFEHKIKLQSGINIYNLRVVDLEGYVLKELKLRIILDTNLPNLVLESPLVDEIEEVVVENQDTDIDDETKDGVGEEEPIIEEYSIVKTWKDKLVFKGKISDDGTGYTLAINGDHVQSSSSRATFGDNEREFEKEVYVEDGDIITLSVSDDFGNSAEFKYKVVKIEAPRIVEVNDPSKEKDEDYSRVIIKTLEEKIYDVFTGAVKLNEILPEIEDTEDYKFDGWYLSADLTEKLDEEKLNEFINEDLTIYPKFIEIEKEDEELPSDNNASSENPTDSEDNDGDLTPGNTENSEDNDDNLTPGKSEGSKDNEDSKNPTDSENKPNDATTKPGQTSGSEKTRVENDSNSEAGRDSNYSKEFNKKKSEARRLLGEREDNPVLPNPEILGSNNTRPNNQDANRNHTADDKDKKDLLDSKEKTDKKDDAKNISDKAENNISQSETDKDNSLADSKDNNEKASNSTRIIILASGAGLLLIASLIFVLIKRRNK